MKQKVGIKEKEALTSELERYEMPTATFQL
jgi:hypothetical protein